MCKSITVVGQVSVHENGFNVGRIYESLGGAPQEGLPNNLTEK